MENIQWAEITFESGKMILYNGNLEVIQIDLSEKKINVNIMDKIFLKRILDVRKQVNESVQQQSTRGKSKVRKGESPLKMLRKVADTLDKKGMTVSFSYKGDKLATIGAEADPTLLQFITKTKAVSVSNLLAIMDLAGYSLPLIIEKANNDQSGKQLGNVNVKAKLTWQISPKDE